MVIKFSNDQRVTYFFRFPRINKETLLPVATNDPYNPKDAWYPPGHGDFYTSLFDSGLLEEFKKAGKELVSLRLI